MSQVYEVTEDTRHFRVSQGEREAKTYAFRIAGNPTVVHTSSYIFKGTTDTTSTNLSGSASVSGPVVTSQTVTGLVGGEVYVLDILCTENGRDIEFWLEIRCAEKETGRNRSK